ERGPPRLQFAAMRDQAAPDGRGIRPGETNHADGATPRRRRDSDDGIGLRKHELRRQRTFTTEGAADAEGQSRRSKGIFLRVRTRTRTSRRYEEAIHNCS